MCLHLDIIKNIFSIIIYNLHVVLYAEDLAVQALEYWVCDRDICVSHAGRRFDE